MSAEWEAVVGLEIHVHLKTRTKMFCRCELEYFAEPNTRTCPVCLAHPGALPVANRKAVEWTIKLGLALGCEIADEAVFSRKNYFYPDNPKGYQISQYEQPLCVGGSLLVPGTGRRPRDRLRARAPRGGRREDDARRRRVPGARSAPAYSLVDFNRGGTPLVEIVTQPDIRSADEAVRFLRLLRQTIVELGHLRRRDGEGHAARRRERLGAAARQRRAAHALGAEEHELVHVHRPRHRARRCATRSRSTSRAPRSSSTRTTTSRTTTA